MRAILLSVTMTALLVPGYCALDQEPEVGGSRANVAPSIKMDPFTEDLERMVRNEDVNTTLVIRGITCYLEVNSTGMFFRRGRLHCPGWNDNVAEYSSHSVAGLIRGLTQGYASQAVDEYFTTIQEVQQWLDQLQQRIFYAFSSWLAEAETKMD